MFPYLHDGEYETSYGTIHLHLSKKYQSRDTKYDENQLLLAISSISFIEFE